MLARNSAGTCGLRPSERSDLTSTGRPTHCGMSMTVIAPELGLSVSRVSRLIAQPETASLTT